jgi:hypothetical protein
MEPTSTTAPPTQKVFIIQGAAGQPKKRFTGTHLAYVSTGENRRKPYWMTLDLYRKADGSYIVHKIGYSVVYHDVTGCEGGEEVTLGVLVEETGTGEPCPKCKPKPWSAIKHALAVNADTTESVLLERNFYTIIESADTKALIKSLEFVPKDSLTGKPEISRPGQILLLRARDHDAQIAAIEDEVEDI